MELRLESKEVSHPTQSSWTKAEKEYEKDKEKDFPCLGDKVKCSVSVRVGVRL